MSDQRSTPVSFGSDELDQIRDMMAKKLPYVCPICGSDLDCAGFVAGDGSQQNALALRCMACNRVAMLRDVGEDQR